MNKKEKKQKLDLMGVEKKLGEPFLKKKIILFLELNNVRTDSNKF